MLVTVEAGAGVWWNYKFIKTAEPPPPSPFQGTWVMAPEAGSLAWVLLSLMSPGGVAMTVYALRDCFYDDEYIFNPDVHTSGDTGETWRSLAGWCGDCDAPVAPHDGSNDAMWSPRGRTLTLSGQGGTWASQAVNGVELASPADTPASITYNAHPQEDGSMYVMVEAGDCVGGTTRSLRSRNLRVRHLLLTYMADSDGSLGVGPAEFDVCGITTRV